MSDDLTKMIQERMASRITSAAQGKSSSVTQHEALPANPEPTEVTSVTEQTPEPQADATPVEAPVAPAVSEPTPSSPIREVLTKANLAVDGLTDDELTASIAKSLADREVERQRVAQLQAELEQLRQQVQQPYAPPVAPPVQQPVATEAEKINRWQRVEIDQNLVRFCEYDDRTEKFLPDPKYGADGHAAAKQLNDAVTEQKRRSQLMINDPVAALSEAGLIDLVQKKIEESHKKFQEQLARTLTERTQQAFQQRHQQEAETEVQQFYESHKSEFFKLNADGHPMKDFDGREVVTERGRLFSQKFNEIRSEFGDALDYHKAVKLAYKLLPPVEQPKPAPAPSTPQTKKQEFIEKARGKPEARKPSPVAEALVQPVPETGNRKMSFREMLVRDPDNAEVLGTLYQGS